MAVIQDRGPFKPGGNGSVFAKAARIQASIQKPGRSAPNPLLNPNQPLSGKALQQAASSLTNAQISGPLAEIAKALAAQDNQTQGTMKLAGSTFNQLGQQAQQGVTDQQQNATSLNNALQQIAGNTNSQLQGIGQNATQSLLSHSPQGDGGLATPALAGLAADIAKQQGIAAQQQGNQQAFGANQGGNYTGLAASQLGTNAVAGTDALKSIAQSGQVKDQPFTQKIADLQAQRGALQATNLGKLRQQEINNRITETGLGLKQQDLTQTAAQNQARNQLTARGQNIQLAGQKVTQANDLANQTLRAAALNEKTGNDQASQALKQAALNLKASQGGQKAGKPRILTPGQQNTIYRNLDEMATLIKTAQQSGHKAADIKQALATGQLQKGFPAQSAVLVEAAYELLGWGHVLPQTANAMRGMGLRGGNYAGKPIQVSGPPQGLKGIGVGGLAGTLKSIGNTL